jgi:DNA-binding SARP family transcriptional activator
MVDAEIHVIGRFAVSVGDNELDVSPTMRRLVGYLALRGRPVPRSHLASLIWPDSPDDRARANLRASFWRVDQLRAHVVHCDDDVVGLTRGASVDLLQMRRRCLAAIRRQRVPDDLGRDPRLLDDLCSSLDGEWIAHDRERWRQLRLHVIVRYLRDLAETGRHDEGIDLAERAAHRAPSLESIAEHRASEPSELCTSRPLTATCGRGQRGEPVRPGTPIHPNSCSQPKEASR